MSHRRNSKTPSAFASSSALRLRSRFLHASSCHRDISTTGGSLDFIFRPAWLITHPHLCRNWRVCALHVIILVSFCAAVHAPWHLAARAAHFASSSGNDFARSTLTAPICDLHSRTSHRSGYATIHEITKWRLSVFNSTTVWNSQFYKCQPVTQRKTRRANGKTREKSQWEPLECAEVTGFRDNYFMPENEVRRASFFENTSVSYFARSKRIHLYANRVLQRSKFVFGVKC